MYYCYPVQETKLQAKGQETVKMIRKSSIGPDRLELIIFDITGKKIDNDPCRLIISF